MYEFNPTLAMPFDQVPEKIREALMSEHLGIISDVDVQAIFRAGMVKDSPGYHVLGACNSKPADRVISSEPNAGTLLPRNFILREDEAGNTVVSFMDPDPVPGLRATDEPKAVAAEARKMLQRVARKPGG